MLPCQAFILEGKKKYPEEIKDEHTLRKAKQMDQWTLAQTV